MNRIFALAVFVVFFLYACGGGSTGTGVKSFSGLIIYSDGTPAEGAKVQISETGASAVSDGNGNFTLETILDEGETEVTVDSLGTASFFLIEDTPSGAATINLEITLDKLSQTLIAAEVSINKPAGDGSPNEEPGSDSHGDAEEPVSTPTPIPSLPPLPSPSQAPANRTALRQGMAHVSASRSIAFPIVVVK